MKESISERLQRRILKEEDYQITLPFAGQDAVKAITATGVTILKDDDTQDLKGRVFDVTSKGTKAGDAVAIRQKLDAALKQLNKDPKLVIMKVTKL